MSAKYPKPEVAASDLDVRISLNNRRPIASYHSFRSRGRPHSRRDCGPQPLQLGLEKVVGDDQRLDRLAAPQAAMA